MSVRKDDPYNPPNTSAERLVDSEADSNLQEKIKNLQYGLKSKSKYVCCPYCQKQGMTKVDSHCSVPAGILCFLGAFLFPVVVQLCRGKDLNCTDTEHYCVGCGNKLASYKTC